MATLEERMNALEDMLQNDFANPLRAMGLKIDELSRNVHGQGLEMREIKMRVATIETHLGTVDSRLNRMGDRLEALDEKIDALSTEMDERFTEMNEKFDALNTDMHKKFDQIIALLSQKD